jgi:radical SAM protein with 4Fe4S-binding SPASM domain
VVTDHPLEILRNSPFYASDPAVRRRVDSRLAREKKFARKRLFNLDVEVTTSCNLACKTCYVPFLKKMAMTGEEFHRVLEAGRELVADLQMDGLWLTLSGGEPLMHRGLWAILRDASEALVCGVALITNGTLLDASAAEAIRALGIDEVMVSLDGATKQTNDAIRGRGTFDRALRGIETLRTVSPDTFLGSTLTLTTRNADEIESFVKLLVGVGANYAWINPPLYCGRLPHSSLGVTYEEHIRVMTLARRLDTQYFQVGFSVYYNIPYYPLTDPISPFLDLSTACPWGRNNLTVTTEGDVLPCLYSRGLVLGNVFRQPLTSIFRHGLLEGYRSGALLDEPCRSCDYRLFCGGCRARTFYLTGKWLGADPWCPLARSRSVRPALPDAAVSTEGA